MYNNMTMQPQQSTYQQMYQVSRPTYPTFQQQPYMGLKGRPVASIEEVRGSIIDFDGSVFFFPDLANKKIYTKQINPDGTSTLYMYELKETPTEAESMYITREEFETALESLRQAMTQPVPKPSSGVQLNF